MHACGAGVLLQRQLQGGRVVERARVYMPAHAAPGSSAGMHRHYCARTAARALVTLLVCVSGCSFCAAVYISAFIYRGVPPRKGSHREWIDIPPAISSRCVTAVDSVTPFQGCSDSVCQRSLRFIHRAERRALGTGPRESSALWLRNPWHAFPALSSMTALVRQLSAAGGGSSARFTPLEVAEEPDVDVQKVLANLPPFRKQLTLRGVLVAAALGAMFCIIT